MEIEKSDADKRECEELVPDYVWADLMAEVGGIIEHPKATFHRVYVNGNLRGFEVRIQDSVVLQVRRARYADGSWTAWADDCPESNWAYGGGAA